MRKPLLFSLLFVLVFITGYSQTNYQAINYAGNPAGNAGFANRADSNAMFNAPTAVAVDTAGNIYVADTYNNAIREILVVNDSVITLAGDTTGYSKGSDSTAGYVNGLGPVARFNNPLGICVDKAGNFVYVADTYNNVIRKIWVVKGNVAKDSVSTVAGKGTLGYLNNSIADSAEFNRPIGVALDTLGNLFVTDEGNDVIREVALTSGGAVSTFAGPQPNDTTLVSGYVNGPVGSAKFLGLYGITFDKTNTMFVTEYKNNSIRKIKNGIVSTVTGFDTIYLINPSSDTTGRYYNAPAGYINGALDTAEFYDPTGIAVDDSGNIYVADEYNYVIRKISTSKGMVSTFAGNTVPGFVNGPVANAEFNDPMGVALDHYGRFYVGDNANNVIRRLYISAPLGIAGINPDKISVLAYPNPCTDKLMIASAPKGTAELLDITGRTVWQDEQFKAPYSISTSDISPGVYFLKVSSATQTAVEKIVVQH